MPQLFGAGKNWDTDPELLGHPAHERTIEPLNHHTVREPLI